MASSSSSSSSLPFIDIFYEDRNIRRRGLALSEAGNLPGWGLNYGDLVSQVAEIIASISNQMPQDGSTNGNLPLIYDITPDESDDAVDVMQEAHVVQDDVAGVPQEAHVVPDDVANVPREAHVVEDHAANLLQGNQNVLFDSSINWDTPPIYDATPDESDDADEMVQDYVADLPLEAHVVPDDVAGVPQDAHVVEDHAANLPQACQICYTNARNMAFLCGHTTCVECGERLDTCHICREPINCRIRLFLE
ncbi:hypothetical protein ACJW30_11G005200 [Castanea mollissima]